MRLKCLLILPLLVASLQAATEADLTFTLISGSTEYSVSDCNESASGSLIIPSNYNGGPVTSIGNDAFTYCTSLNSITIPNSVTSIGNFAFYRCLSLTNIAIPESVTSIGDYAFESCSGLSSITIPDSVSSIGDFAFYYCTSLTSITIPEGVTSIGSNAFYGCSGLSSITIPDSVSLIGSEAFLGCTGLNEINLPYRYYSTDWEDIGLTSASYPIVPQLVLDEARLSMIANI